MDEHLDQKTNNQLKQLLRDFGLPVSGNKSTLIARLRAKYCSLADEIENGSDDDEQFDEQLEEFMANAHEYCQDGMQNEDAEYDLSDHDLHFLGTLQRNQAQLPSHLYQCPLVEQMTKYIERTFNMKFIRPDASALEQILVDSTPVLNNSRSPKTHQAYMTVGCLFLIYICFFTTSPVDISSALFTWKNCADFLKQYVTMPKRITLRGTAGLSIPSMGMLNKCAMVLNGMFRRERECWKTYLSGNAFDGKHEFFLEPIEKGRPAVAHNHDWREIYKAHSHRIRKGQEGNSLPNAEVIKAGVRLTDDECYAIAYQLLGQGGLNNVRNAAIIASNLVAVTRTGDMTQSLFKDIRHAAFRCGTSTHDLYSPCLLYTSPSPRD